MTAREQPRLPRVYRYGFATGYALLMGNYMAWRFDYIDWRCIAAAVLGAVLVLVILRDR